MRARYVAIGIVILLFGIGWWQHQAAGSADDLGPSVNWHPTATEIGAVLGGGPGTWKDGRHERFGELFTQRFRDHDLAIRGRYVGEHFLSLQCAANIPRWQMTQIAIQLHDEARQTFGEECKVDIYETYITIRRRKVAELRAQPNGRSTVLFNPVFIDVPQSGRVTRRPQFSGPPTPPTASRGASHALVPGSALPRSPEGGPNRSQPPATSAGTLTSQPLSPRP